MKGYKGFKKGLVCRGKQYAENTVFEEDKAEICESGMHFCEAPFDVWEHYPPCDENGNLNEFAEVEALADTQTDDEKKFCTTKLRIGAKISFADFVKAGVDFVLNKTKSNTNSTTGNRSAATNTGNCSAATNTGYCSAATNTGDYSAATVNGDDSVAIVTGYKGKAKGKIGCWIACVERNEKYKIIDFKAVKVDGETIKPDVFYRLENGKFVEVEGDLKNV